MAHRLFQSTLMILMILIAGCTIIPLGSNKNEPSHDDMVPITRASTSFENDEYLTSQFVGIAISGGGSRAANFGAATLQLLYEHGFLEHVTAISSVSGGSLASGYYAAKSHNLSNSDEWKNFKEDMRIDFISQIILRSLNPYNAFLYFFSNYDRSDLLASVFDRSLFSEKTYAYLQESNPSGPKILINVTLADSGMRLPFSREFFDDIGSRLDTFPIANAVAASGAFPLVFNSATLRDYQRQNFWHVYDGGPADNLAVETLLDTARNHFLEISKRGQFYDGCLLFVVDSHASQYQIYTPIIPDGRKGLIDFFVDRNAIDAINTLLTQRRHETLLAMGLTQPIEYRHLETRLDHMIRRPPDLTDDKLWEREAVAPIGRVSLFDRFDDYFRWMEAGGHEGISEDWGKAECKIWHIHFDRLFGIGTFVDQSNVEREIIPYIRTNRDNDFDLNDASIENLARNVFLYRAYRGLLVNRIATNYKLSGVGDCSAEQLQEGIFDAADILIREDYESVAAVCSWFSDRGLEVMCPKKQVSRTQSALDETINWRVLFDSYFHVGVFAMRPLIRVGPSCSELPKNW